MRRQGCQRKWEKRIVRETAHTSKTTKSNTHYTDLRVDGIPNDEAYKGRAVHAKNRRTSPKTCDYERSIKDDSLQDHILSEKAVKKIHEAGNCELREIQQRTNKVQCQRCHTYTEAGFQVCPCGGQLNMSEEMFSASDKKIQQLIAREEPDRVLNHGKRTTS